MTSPYIIRKKINDATVIILTDGLSNPAFIIAQSTQIGTQYFINMYRRKSNGSKYNINQPQTVGVWRITYHSKNKNK